MARTKSGETETHWASTLCSRQGGCVRDLCWVPTSVLRRVPLRKCHDRHLQLRPVENVSAFRPFAQMQLGRLRRARGLLLPADSYDAVEGHRFPGALLLERRMAKRWPPSLT
jgi:hypothetical protein